MLSKSHGVQIKLSYPHAFAHPVLSDGLRVMAEMEERARQEPQFRPRPHVFLALMRAFAEQGKLPRTRELAHRMVPALGWHVWPEDRAEAEELVMEAAVNAGEVRRDCP